jgi:hypothetical protein
MPSEDQDILAKISQLAGEFGATTYQIAKESELTDHLKARSTVIRTSSSMLHILYIHKQGPICNGHITVG